MSDQQKGSTVKRKTYAPTSKKIITARKMQMFNLFSFFSERSGMQIRTCFFCNKEPSDIISQI